MRIPGDERQGPRCQQQHQWQRQGSCKIAAPSRTKATASHPEMSASVPSRMPEAIQQAKWTKPWCSTDNSFSIYTSSISVTWRAGTFTWSIEVYVPIRYEVPQTITWHSCMYTCAISSLGSCDELGHYNAASISRQVSVPTYHVT